MPAAKRSISFDADVIAAAEAEVRFSGTSLSAFVNAAVERELKLTGLRKLMEADERELGPIPPEIREKIERQWPL